MTPRRCGRKQCARIGVFSRSIDTRNRRGADSISTSDAIGTDMSLPPFILEDVALYRSGHHYATGSSLGAAWRLTNCAGVWTDVQIDGKNCGSCGVECTAAQSCCGGSCVPLDQNCGGCGSAFACLTGQTCCPRNGDFACTNTASDVDNCAACGNRCDFVPYLVPDSRGSRIGRCCAGSGCPFNPQNPQGCCLNTLSFRSDPQHCGNCETDCAVTCGPNCICSEGHCCPPCTQWFDGAANGLIEPGCYSCSDIGRYSGKRVDCCDGKRCTFLDFNDHFCGHCRRDCTTEIAWNAKCTATRDDGTPRCQCPPNLPDVCDFTCVNLSTGTSPNSPSYCGTCGNVCAPGEACCNGVCTVTMNNRLHCGRCGAKCDVACCGNKCVDVFSDPNNCWNCGHKCAPGESCIGGVCSPPVPPL